MKTVKAYEVGGKLFRNKKDAEKEDVAFAKKKEFDALHQKRQTILDQLNEVNMELDKYDVVRIGNTDVPKSEGHKSENRTPKFKIGDRVRVTRTQPLGNGLVGKIDEYNGIDSYHVNYDSFFGSDWYKSDELVKIEGSSTPNIKIGDRVVIKYCDSLRGKRGTVDEVCEKSDIVGVMIDDGERVRVWSDYLEKIEAGPTKPNIKIGDRVRWYNKRTKKHEAGVVVDNKPNDYTQDLITVATCDGRKGYFNERDLEKTNKGIKNP